MDQRKLVVLGLPWDTTETTLHVRCVLLMLLQKQCCSVLALLCGLQGSA